MRLITIAAALVAAATVVAGAAASPPKPEAMLKQVLQYDGLGQYGRAYDLLVPGQKRLINRDRWMDCMSDSLASYGGFKVTAFRKVDQYRDPIHVSGVSQKPIVAVTVKYTLEDDNGKAEKDTTTWHAVWVGSRWAWMMSSLQVAAYRAGRCPS